MKKKKSAGQGFLHGALILVIANVLVKVIGAGFKVPLTYMIGPDGMGIYSVAYEVYKWLFIVATAGLPIAISKMVSESMVEGNGKLARRIFQVAMTVLVSFGFVGTLVLMVGANFFADAFKNSLANYAIMALAPSLFFVCIMSAFRGYFQGMQDMVPTAVSEVTEAIGKLVFGILLAYLLYPYGIQYAAAGAVLGVSLGTIMGALVLSLIYRNRKRNGVYSVKEFMNEQKPLPRKREIIKKLIAIAVPITIGASVFSLTTLIDAYMVMGRLQTIAGIGERAASTLYGYFSSYVVPLFSFPPTLVVSLGISVVPALSAALKRRDEKQAGLTINSGLRIAALIAFPAAIGMCVLAGPILQLVYHVEDRLTPEILSNVAVAEGLLQMDIVTIVTRLLNIMAIPIIFVSLVSVMNSILQAAGKTRVPVYTMVVGGVLKVIVNYILVATPSINILGAPIGTNICYFVILLLDLAAIRKYIKVKIDFKGIFLKPLAASLVMGVVAYYGYKGLYALTNISSVSALLSICVAALVYLVGICLIGGIAREDIRTLPKGETIESVLLKLHLLR